MKKLIFILLAIMTVSLGACTINGNKSNQPGEVEPAVLSEGWDDPYYSDNGYAIDAPLSGVFPYDAAGATSDVWFSEEGGLRFLQPLGSGSEIAAFLPDGASDIRFGTAFVIASDAQADPENFVGGHTYKSGHTVYCSFEEESVTDKEELILKQYVAAYSAISVQNRNYDRSIAARPVVEYSVNGHTEYIYADSYNVENLFEKIYKNYYLKGKTDAYRFIDEVIASVVNRRNLHADIKAGIASVAGDFVTVRNYDEAEGSVYDYTADYASLIDLGNGVSDGLSYALDGIYSAKFWKNSAYFIPVGVYYRTLVNGAILTENTVDAVLAALGDGELETVEIVASDKNHEDFLSVVFVRENYVKLSVNDGFVYDRNNHITETASVEYGAPGAVLSFSGNDAVSAGNYSVDVCADGFRILDPASNEKQTVEYVVSPRKVNVSVDPKTVVYGHGEVSLTATVTDAVGSLEISADETELVLAREEGNAAGEYAITGYLGSGNFFTDGVVGNTYTILKAEYTEAPEYVASGTPELSAYYGNVLAEVSLPNGWTWADGTAVLSSLGAGTHSALFASANENYKTANLQLSVNVSARPVTVIVLNQSAVYSAAEPEIPVEEYVTVTDGAGNLSLTAAELGLSLVKVPGKDVGSYALTGEWSNDNYSVSFIYTKGEASVFAIVKKVVSVEWGTETEFEYNGGPQAPSIAVAGIITGDDCEVKVSSFTSAGNYISTLYVSGVSARNYAFASGTVGTKAFVINKKPVVIEWTVGNYVYDGTYHLPTATATNLESGDQCVITVSGARKNAGNGYVATATALSNPNYVLPEDHTRSFDVKKREIGISWADGTFVYNGLPQAPTATATNLVAGDTCALTVTEFINAGRHEAEVTALGNDNYVLPSVGLTRIFDISQKGISVTVRAVAEYGVNGYTAAPVEFYVDGVLSAEAATDFSSQSITLSDVSGYDVYLSGGVASYKNYGDIVAYKYDCENENFSVEEYTVWLKINQRVAEIEWTDDSFVYDGTEHIPAATITNLLPRDEGDYYPQLDGAKVNAGNYTATILSVIKREGENVNYALPAVVTKDFCISKKGITVSWQFFEEDSARDGFTTVYNNANYTLRATPSASYNETVLTVINAGGGEVFASYKNVGTYTARALLTEAAALNYEILPDAVTEKTFTITKAPVTVVADAKSKNYDNTVVSASELTYTVYYGHGQISSLVQTSSGASDIYGEVLDIALNSGACSDSTANEAGYTVTVTAGDGGVNANYDIVTVNSSFKVMKISYDMSAVEFESVERVYDGTTHTVTLSPEFENVIGLDGSKPTVSYSNNYATNKGQVTAVATFTVSSPNYNVPAQMTATVNVTARPVTVNIFDYVKVYDKTAPKNSDISANYDIENGLTSTASDIALALTVAGASADAGEYPITASHNGNGNYVVTVVYTANGNSVYTVEKHRVRVTVADQQKVYDGNVPSISYAAGYLAVENLNGAPVTKEEISLTLSAGNSADAGRYDLVAAYTDSANYDITVDYTATATVYSNYVIERRIVNVSVYDNGKVYDGAVPAVSYEEEYFAITAGNGAATITKEEIELELVIEGATKNAGAYDIVAVYPSHYAENYDIRINYTQTGRSVYTVSARPVGVEVNDVTITYGDAYVAPTYTVTDGTVVQGDDLGITLADTTAERNAGTYYITVPGNAWANANYAVTFFFTDNENNCSVYTINKCEVEVTVKNQSKVYDGNDPFVEVNGQYVTLNTVNRTSPATASDIALALEIENVSADVGIYVIHASYTDSQNYAVTATDGTFTIEKCLVTVTVSNRQKTYDGSSPEADYGPAYFNIQTLNRPGADVTRDEINASLEILNVSAAVGSYVIHVSYTDSQNYAVTATDGTFTVNPRSVTVSVGDKTITYGDVYVAPTYAVTEGTVVPGDDLGITVEKAVTSIDGTTTGVNAGTYYITVPGNAWTNANYAVTFFFTDNENSRSVYTINKAQGAVDLSNNVVENLTKEYDGEPIVPAHGYAVTGDGTLTVSYKLVSAADGAWTTDYTQIRDIGAYNVRFELSETANYLGITPIIREFHISGNVMFINNVAGGAQLQPNADFTKYTVTYSGEDLNFVLKGKTNVIYTYNNATYNNGVTVKDAGVYVVSAEADGETYTAEITIYRRELTVNWGETSFVYDGNEHNNHSVGGSVAADGIVYSSEIISYTPNENGTDGSVIKNAGVYTVRISVTNANYTFGGEDYVEHVYTVSKAAYNAAGSGYTAPVEKTAVYGSVLSAITLGTGWAWTDSSLSVGNVGLNSFEAIFTPADINNYNTRTENWAVNVTPATLTVTAVANTITYGEAPANNGAEYSGFVNGENASVLGG
ncbi:MAG: hypothetical protein J6Z34_00770, partial [Clostridia bacterium]|nr:hypothetical protein [Clostridia bacterium]